MSRKSLNGIDAGGKTLTGVGTPSSSTDAATKGYADTGDAALITRTKGGQDSVAAASGTSGTVTLNVNNANVFTLTPTGDVTTLTISNVPSSVMCRIELIVSQGGTARAIALPSGGHYHGPTPTQVANKDCIFVLETVDGGTTWHVWASLQA